MSLAFLPYYIKLLGAEAYGFVGLHVSVFAIISFFDMGLSTAINRSLSLTDLSDASKRQDGRNLGHTFELIYWGVGIVLAVLIWLIAPLIAEHWINLSTISVSEARHAISLIALVILFQWPIALYTGCMLGMEDQVRLNLIKIVQSTLQWGGAVLVLSAIAPTIEAYFVWQSFVGLLSIVVMRFFVLRKFAASGVTASPKFESKHWHTNKEYFKGLTAITLFSVILTQTDRLIISKMMPMQALGYYTFAFSLANSLQYLGHPIYAAVFPRLSRLVSSDGAHRELADFYHRTAQVLTTLVAPICLTLAFFSHEILEVWAKQPDVVENTYEILALLCIGSALNVIMLPPLALQLASQWTSLSIVKNMIAIVAYLPLLYFSVQELELKGAAYCWILLNLGYVLFEVPVMHSRLLKKEKWRWYIHDLLLPLVLTIFFLLLIERVGINLFPNTPRLLLAAVGLAGTLLACSLILPLTRSILFEQWAKIGKGFRRY